MTTIATAATGQSSFPEGYVPRRIAFRELWSTDGWRLKVYGIAYGQSEPRLELVETAKRLASTVLPPASARGVEGVGFVGAHDARGGSYVFVDWWADENELHHRGFLGPSPDAVRPARDVDSTACVWDLAVIDFERRAWYEMMLVNPGGSAIEAYMARHFETLL